jgi:uncharacterized protein YdgA (DUF945 family)
VLLMKKLILLLALVTVAVLCGLSVWGSLRAEQAYRQVVLRVTQSPDLRILETSYQRGWLQSRALADIEVRGALGESFQQWLVARGREEVRGRVGIRVRNTIEHGYAPLLDWLNTGLQGTPIVARVETQLELDKETQSEISAVLGLMPPVTVSTLIRASGIGESLVTIPAQRIASRLGEEEGGGWALEWKGLRGSAVYTTDFGHVTANIQSAGFEGGNAISGVVLQDLTCNADLMRDASGLMLGEVKTWIGSLRLVSVAEESPGIEFDHLATTQTSTVESGGFSSSLLARVQAIRYGEHVYGPGEIEFSLRNLDAATLARLQNDGLFGPVSSESEAVQRISAESGTMHPRWLDLLSRSPQLELRRASSSTAAVRSCFAIPSPCPLPSLRASSSDAPQRSSRASTGRSPIGWRRFARTVGCCSRATATAAAGSSSVGASPSTACPRPWVT